MEEILRYLKTYEVLVYIVLGALAAWQLRKFFSAWEELRAAAFGLERESAQSQLNKAAAVLILLLVFAVAEYALVTYVAPNVEGANPLPTSTIDVLATPTSTLPTTTATESGQGQETAAVTPEEETAGCVPGEVMIRSPQDEDRVRGTVEVLGTAKIPDFGFYKFEISSFDAGIWLTVQANDQVVEDDQLGFWDTTQIEPGQYELRLVVFDNEGEQRDPCVVTIFVDEPPEE